MIINYQVVSLFHKQIKRAIQERLGLNRQYAQCAIVQHRFKKILIHSFSCDK